METNSLILNVKSDTVGKATDRLKALSTEAGKTEKATDRLSKANSHFINGTNKANTATSKRVGILGRLTFATKGATKATGALVVGVKSFATTMMSTVAPILAILAPLLTFQKIISSTVELQDWEAQLKTATGSAELAAEAFRRMETFASETPYALEQSVNAFIKLKNLGLDPSEEALRSYGNTASAMGKGLDQLIEAVADATTGEFERLKEFGIKSKSEGDKVTFTFRGMSKTIQKEAGAIEQYLQDIGNTEFAGAMVERMDTVGGKISNLGDLWDKLFRTISEMGVGDLIGQGVDFAIGFLEKFIALIKSGAVESELESWGVAFRGWGDLVGGVFGKAAKMFNDLVGLFIEEGDRSTLGLLNAIKKVPATVKYWIQRAGLEIEFLSGYATTAGIKIFKSVKSYLTQVWEVTKTFAAAIGDSLLAGLNPFDERGFSETLVKNIERATNKAFRAVQRETQKTDNEVAELNKQLQKLKDERIAGIQQIGEEFFSIAAEIDQADRATQRFIDSLGQAQGKLTFIGKMKTSEEDPTIPLTFIGKMKTSEEDPTAPKETRRSGVGRSRSRVSSGPSEFEKLVEDLRGEEMALEGSYLKRLELVRKNTAAGSAIRQELTQKVQEEYHQDLEAFREKKIAEMDILRDGFSLQLDELNQFYDRRRELILSNEALTEQEKTQMLVALHKERNGLIRDLEIERAKQGLSMLSEHFEGAAQLAQSSNKKLASIGRAALVAQKAIAITQATIKTYESATSAYASLAGIPVVGPALGAAAAGAAIAAGLANVAAISSSNTNVGNYQNGGIIPGTSYSGDRLTAGVNSGEMIINASQQRRLFDMANGSSPGSNRGGSVTIINQTRNEIEGETQTNENGDIEIVIREAVKRTKSELTKEANDGGGSFVPTLENRFGLRRTGTN